MPPRRRGDLARTGHALQHDPLLLALAPAATTPSLHHVQAPQDTVSMAVYTHSAQRFASLSARRPTPDAYGGDVGKHEELAPRMAPAECLHHRAGLAIEEIEPVVTGIGVGLQDAGELPQMPLRVIARPIAGRAEQRRRRRCAAEGSIVADIDPSSAGIGLRQDWHRGIVAGSRSAERTWSSTSARNGRMSMTAESGPVLECAPEGGH